MSPTLLRKIPLDSDTPEDEIARYIDEVRRHPDQVNRLVALLPQRHKIYSGRGSNQIARIRGYILASFEQLGLSETALIYALEELENSQNPYLVAAAAKAIRGLSRYSTELAPYLFCAISNVQYRDDEISFDSYKSTWPLENHTTALKEIFRTFQGLRAYARPALSDLEALQANPGFSADIRREVTVAVEAIRNDDRNVSLPCCDLPRGKGRRTLSSGLELQTSDQIETVEFQDQHGHSATYAEIFRDKPTVLAFFYTRCGNPNKCALTVTKLAQLQSRIAEEGLAGRIRVVAVTYDPGHDDPDRLNGYCANRGFVFDADNLALRADRKRFDEVSEHFHLGVSYSSSIVNHHQIELYLLDSLGRIGTTYTNLQWNVEDVLSDATTLAESSNNRVRARRHWRNFAGNVWALSAASAIALFPKCPFCWAAYMSALGLSGVTWVHEQRWLLPALMLVMLVHLYSVYRRSCQRRVFMPCYASLLGFALLLTGFAASTSFLRSAGVCLVLIGSITNSLSFRTHLLLRRKWHGLTALITRSAPAIGQEDFREPRSQQSLAGDVTTAIR